MQDVKGCQKGYCRYISINRKFRENVDTLLNGSGNLVTNDPIKTEVLNAFLASVFTGKTDKGAKSPILIGERADQGIYKQNWTDTSP